SPGLDSIAKLPTGALSRVAVPLLGVLTIDVWTFFPTPALILAGIGVHVLPVPFSPFPPTLGTRTFLAFLLIIATLAVVGTSERLRPIAIELRQRFLDVAHPTNPRVAINAHPITLPRCPPVCAFLKPGAPGSDTGYTCHSAPNR